MTTDYQISKDGRWVIDKSNNRASISYWGTASNAKNSLHTLKNCKGCVDCKNCENCRHCTNCAVCTNCSKCKDCKFLVGKRRWFLNLPIQRWSSVRRVWRTLFRF